MIHLGDITKLSGYEVPPVDCVIGGSPCQDLSIAGKRAGIAGQRSGLFAEQIRIVKEMRDADRLRGRTGQFIRPRYMVWENVPGAFSSNKGEDFRAVLEETIRIAEPEAPDVPLPPKGKWPLADAWYGDGWSVAYRVFDAQFWGVPQRRRRIALVADFGGQSAPEILFERARVSWNTPEGAEKGQAVAGGAGQCACETSGFMPQAGGNTGLSYLHEKAPTLIGNQKAAVMCACFKAGNGPKANGIGYEPEKAPTLSAASSGTNQVPAVFDARGNGNGETVPTITGDHENRVTDYAAIVFEQQGFGDYRPSPVCSSAKARDWKDATDLVRAAVDCRNGVENTEVNGTLQAKATGGTSLNLNNVVRVASVVRRLTPLECERLQGFPDGWTDIGDWTNEKGKRRKTSDAARYKALGNSIALPPWKWVLKRLCALYERDATMASLFDGIGGFPLIWERLNGTGTCLWASEIEEFPMAVTRKRFVSKK